MSMSGACGYKVSVGEGSEGVVEGTRVGGMELDVFVRTCFRGECDGLVNIGTA
jgi:hypothetical protein